MQMIVNFAVREHIKLDLVLCLRFACYAMQVLFKAGQGSPVLKGAHLVLLGHTSHRRVSLTHQFAHVVIRESIRPVLGSQIRCIANFVVLARIRLALVSLVQ